MAKRGRPFSDDPKDKIVAVRMNCDEVKMLEKACKLAGMNKTDTIRTAIENLYKSKED